MDTYCAKRAIPLVGSHMAVLPVLLSLAGLDWVYDDVLSLW